MSSMLRLLQKKEYRSYFFGQFISMSGTWMQSVVQSWLVYELTQSAFWVALVHLCNQLPAFFVGPFAGVIADRLDRRRILVIVQVLFAVEAGLLAALVLFKVVAVWHILALSIFAGILNAFEITTRHSLAIDFVGRSDLPRAIALNSILINSSRVIGPMMAGFLVPFISEGGCFLLNSLSCVPIAFSLRKMSIRQPLQVLPQESVLRQIRDAFVYVRNEPVILRLLVFCIGVCFFSSPYSVLLPVFAKTVLNGDTHTLASLTGFVGFGAVVAAFFFHPKKSLKRIKAVLLLDIVTWSLAMVLLGVSQYPLLSYLAVFLIGFSNTRLFATINITIQKLVLNSMRGRVMSLYTMAFVGATPMGGLVSGWLADALKSAPGAMILGGLCSLSLGGLIVGHNHLRHRRYVMKRKKLSVPVHLPSSPQEERQPISA